MKKGKSTQDTAQVTPPTLHFHDFEKNVAKLSKVANIAKFAEAKEPKVAKVQKASKR